MSEPSRSLDATDTLDAETVAAYLRGHPDFLRQHPELLDDLQLDAAEQGQPSLTTLQLQRLRETNAEQHARLSELLDNARRNDALFETMRTWVGQLIECRTPLAVIELTSRALEADFGADAATLCFIADVPVLSTGPHVACIGSQAARDAGLEALAAPGQVICGLLRASELEALFGARSAGLQSAIVLGLEHPDIRGVLAAARRDPSHFRPGMDTLFVRFAADLLCRMLARLDFRC